MFVFPNDKFVFASVFCLYLLLNLKKIGVLLPFSSRLRLYGFNSMEIEVPSYWNLFINEVSKPLLHFSFSFPAHCSNFEMIYVRLEDFN